MLNLIKLMRFIKGHYWGLILGFVSLVATTAFSLVIPKVLGGGVDTALSSGNISALVIAGAVILGSSIMRGLTGYGNRYYAEATSQQVAYDIRNALYSRLQNLSFAYHDQAQTGQLMSRATVDIEAVRNFISMGLLPLLQTVFMVFGIAWVLLALDWRLALITLAFMPVIAWRVVATSNKMRPVWLSVQQNIATMGTILQENLMGIRVVKAFSRQKEESQKFATASQKQYDLQVTGARIQAINAPMMTFLLGVPTALVLWYGGKQVIDGTLTMGGVTQFILYLGMLGMPIRRLGGIANTFSRSVSAGERITEILETESPVKEKLGAVEVGRLSGQVTFENVSFSYKPELAPALENISFEAKPGQLIALLGGSGSGKSTLINLVARFYDVTKGRITVDGNNVRDITLASLRKNIGIAQQDVFLFSATIRDNIAYGIPDASLEQIIEAAKAAQINNFIQSLPDGYNTWVGERGHTLSGGEKQRVAIARTLLINPAILILDDSTSAVDAETEHLIRLALDKLIVGRTTFIITHRLPIIKRADLILMLKDGKVIEAGKHDDLMAKDGLYRSTYISQLAATADSLATN